MCAYKWTISIHPLCFISSLQQRANLIPSLFSRPLILCLLIGSRQWAEQVDTSATAFQVRPLSLWHYLNYITYIKLLSAFVRSHEQQLWLLRPMSSFMCDRLILSFMYRFNREISPLKMHWVEQSCQAVSAIITYITSLFRERDSWVWNITHLKCLHSLKTWYNKGQREEKTEWN